MNRTTRTATALGAATLMALAGAGSASAQGSSDLPLPDLGSLARLLGAPQPTPAPIRTAPNHTAPATTTQPTTTQPTTPTAPATPADAIADQAFAGRLVAAINDARSGVSAPRLTTDSALQTAAGRNAAQMAATGRLSSDLKAPSGFRGHGWNAVALTPTAKPEEVMAFVMADPGRRDTMLDRAYTHVGAGKATGADGNVYIVVEYGTR